MEGQFAVVLVFTIVAILFVFGSLLFGSLIRPKLSQNLIKRLPYESGEHLFSKAWIQFNIRFYLIALVFLIFDVELLFLYPVASVFNDFLKTNKWLVFTEFFLFIGILLLGLAYAWAKGDLEWVKPKPKYTEEDVKKLESSKI